MAEFQVDPAFEAGSIAVGELPLCHVRLQDDARWPWLILIPRQAGLREIEDLSAKDRHQLLKEGILAGNAVRAIAEVLGHDVFKLNMGALGNVTAQLHLHVVGRWPEDAAWPGPVWGVSGAERYSDWARSQAILTARATLKI